MPPDFGTTPVASCPEPTWFEATPEPTERLVPMKVVLVVDVGRIAMAIALILELMK